MKRTRINIRYQPFRFQSIRFAAMIKKAIMQVLVEEGIGVPAEINVLITDNEGIHRINYDSRGIDRPTDVLSFPMFQLEPGDPPAEWLPYMDPDTGLCPLGDMAISLEQAIKQAGEFGHSVHREIGYLTIHSMLHLLGYDHLDEGPEKKTMRSREEHIASVLKLTR